MNTKVRNGLMINLNKVNDMYVCPICGSKASIEFSVGKRNDSGYPMVASAFCKNGCLRTEKIDFKTLYQMHDFWNAFVEDYIKNNEIK